MPARSDQRRGPSPAKRLSIAGNPWSQGRRPSQRPANTGATKPHGGWHVFCNIVRGDGELRAEARPMERACPWKRNLASKLVVDHVSMAFKTPTGVFQALAPVTPVDPAGPFRQPDRPVGLRQEHDLQHHRRTAGAERGARADRRRRCDRHHRPRRLHAAEGPAAAVAHRARQRHPRHGDPGRAAARGARTGAAAAAALRAVGLRASLSQFAVGRHAPARGAACARSCSTPT